MMWKKSFLNNILIYLKAGLSGTHSESTNIDQTVEAISSIAVIINQMLVCDHIPTGNDTPRIF